jgi:hypothetical protein
VMLMDSPSAYISCFPGSPRITGSPGGSKQQKNRLKLGKQFCYFVPTIPI